MLAHGARWSVGRTFGLSAAASVYTPGCWLSTAPCKGDDGAGRVTMPTSHEVTVTQRAAPDWGAGRRLNAYTLQVQKGS